MKTYVKIFALMFMPVASLVILLKNDDGGRVAYANFQLGKSRIEYLYLNVVSEEFGLTRESYKILEKEAKEYDLQIQIIGEDGTDVDESDIKKELLYDANSNC